MNDGQRTPPGRRLRQAMASGEILPFIGVYDLFSASIAARHFDGIFVSGFSFAASFYGLPNVGFISWSDIVAFVQRVRGLLSRHHILVDIDDGYGDAEVACHVVSLLESAGASGVVLEDQMHPRRGHLEGKQLLELPEFLGKLEKVLAARREMVVVARTDAVEMDEILRRTEAFTRAGADAILVSAVRDLDLLRTFPRKAGRSLVFSQAAGGKSPIAGLGELAEAGVSLVLYGTPCLFTAQEAIEEAMRSLREKDGSLKGLTAGVDLKTCNALLQENLVNRDRREEDLASANPPAPLWPDSRKLLDGKLRQGASKAADPSIPRRPENGSAPLSFAQQRLWFLEQLEPDVPVYNVPVVVRLEGDLDVPALEWSLGQVVARHEALRTTFESAAGEPLQVIGPPFRPPVPVVDLREIPNAEREAASLRLAVAEAQRPFDLARGPLLRSRLLRLADREHLFLLTMHHIASDAWSIGVLFRELEAFYEAHPRGESPSLPELPIQYADFAVWQRKWLGEVLETQLSYWKKQLAGAPPVLELPCDRPRAPARSHRGARHAWTLPKSLAERIQALARRERATLFMTLLAAFQALLSRYTGEEDIPVGSPIAGRNREETEGLIGFFVNTLVLRGDLSGDPTFRELLGRVRETALSAYSHQDIPFERLVEELQPQRSLAHMPLFQVMFSLQNASSEIRRFSDLAATVVKIDRGITGFDLSLDVTEKQEGLSCVFEFSTDLFDSGTIVRFAGSFETMLAAIAADPGQHIARLPLLDAVQRRKILLEWNDTGADFPRDRCLHQLFEEQAERTPDAVAVVFEEERLSYRELNRRANQLARHLRSLGVRPDVPVAISIERSLDLVVGLLGILKAGGAYVPLDPAYPRERLALILEEMEAPVVVSLEKSALALPTVPARVLLDREREAVGRESGENFDGGASAENLAYVIYTSGSTGRPKGVMVPHRAICNHVHWMQETFPLTPADRVLQKTPASFDASVWEFYAPLLAGARLVMGGPEAHHDTAQLVRTIERHQVTILQFVPSLLDVFLEEQGLERCRSLRRVLCGGGPMTSELSERFFRRFSAELCNLYGPTETTIDATSWICKRGGPEGAVPIGRPIANLRAYALDGGGEPVPIGVAGEIFVGGAGVGRGYWKRPELTAERFVPDPFVGEAGARMYRTGDRGRYSADGNLEFLGRLDHQVKIRGFRIELGEIETVLRELPAVRQAVVLAREDGGSEKHLVAYLVAESEPPPGARELRSHLRERLPDSMVPSVFVPLACLPLTPSGKVDRLSLPPPPPAGTDREEALVLPRTPVEKIVAKVWAEVLRLERVGVHDNFFEVGGHSLLAIQVFSRIRNAFAVGLPLRTLFEAPTIADLSGAIEKALGSGGALNVSPIVPISRQAMLRHGPSQGVPTDTAGKLAP